MQKGIGSERKRDYQEYTAHEVTMTESIGNKLALFS